jgi:peptide/nickel transport system permease protein
MRADYVVRRLFLLVLIIWLAATINFFLPRLSGQDPIREKLIQQSVQGGYLQQGIQETAKEYERKFGLDRPLWQQYLTFLSDTARLDFNYSMANYPKRVTEMMAEALPWTIGLLTLTTVLAFALGTFLGALLAWPRAPRFLEVLLPPLLTLSAIPYYLLGLVLLWIFSFQAKLLPIFGGYTAGTIPEASLGFWLDILRHATLPALSIILAAIGFWALGMRAMMITTQGEDFVTFAEAKGLKSGTLFFRYAIRNAMLPQVTGLGLALGHILSGAVLVEVVFAYPGIGTVLYRSIRAFDYFAIQGMVFAVIVSIAIATFILDVIYPLIDPRITYRRA